VRLKNVAKSFEKEGENNFREKKEILEIGAFSRCTGNSLEVTRKFAGRWAITEWFLTQAAWNDLPCSTTEAPDRTNSTQDHAALLSGEVHV
jgi:hypothetical protein